MACNRTFQNVAEFDRHRLRGRCRTDIHRPSISQADRDRLADPDLLDLDDRVGADPHAVDITEAVAS